MTKDTSRLSFTVKKKDNAVDANPKDGRTHRGVVNNTAKSNLQHDTDHVRFRLLAKHFDLHDGMEVFSVRTLTHSYSHLLTFAPVFYYSDFSSLRLPSLHALYFTL